MDVTGGEAPKARAEISPDELEARRQRVSAWIAEHAIARTLAEGVETSHPMTEFEEREYQLEAWASLWEARQDDQGRALVHLATGLGKTNVAVLDVMKYRQECEAQDPPMVPRILFVSHMKDISEQAQERFSRFMPDLDAAYFDTRQDIPDADITFATFQSLHSHLDKFDPQDYEYIIYDEAHHTEAETFKAVRDHFDPLFELALTATPDRGDGQNIREYFGEAVYSKELPEAMAEGWLADVDYHIVFDDMVKQLIEDGFEPKTLKEFRELFKIRPRNEVIAKNIREERHKIGLDTAKTIVFCEDMDHAEEMAELLEGTAYHSGLDKDERERVLNGFRSDGNNVICTVDMFNEGVDIPDARLAVFLRSTQSDTIFKQQLGRILRRAPGKEVATVLDFVANIERISNVRELSQKIQRRASELNQQDVAEEGTILNRDNENTGGLQLHTEHSDFDFDKIAVDLLEKFGNLNLENAPEGYMSIKEFAERIGHSTQRVMGTALALEQELCVFKFHNSPGKGVSPSQQQLISHHLAMELPAAVEGMKTVLAFAKELGISDITVKRIAEAEGLELKKYKLSGGTTALGLTSDHQDVIRQHPLLRTKEAPEGFITVTGFAKQEGISQTTLNKIIAGLEMSVTSYKTPRGRMAGMLSPSQQDQLRQQPIIRLRPPEGYLSAYGFAKTHGVPEERVKKVIDEIGLELTNYSFKTRITFGLSPEDQRIVLTHLGLTN